jgi:hypothetical protein
MASIVTFGPVAPALDREGRDANDAASLQQPRAAGLRLVDRAQDYFSLGPSVSSSSS